MLKTIIDSIYEMADENQYNIQDIHKQTKDIQRYVRYLANPYKGEAYQIEDKPISSTDADALQHFYGCKIIADKYGVPKSLLAGLFHELEGMELGHTTKSIKADIINNISGLMMGGNAPKYNTDQLLALLEKNYSTSLYGDEPLSIEDKTILDGLLTYGLDWTVDPPRSSKSNIELEQKPKIGQGTATRTYYK